MLGTLVISVMEAMDDRVYSDAELRRLLPVSVLSELPVISDPADEQRQHIHARIAWATTATVALSILAGSVVSYLKG